MIKRMVYYGTEKQPKADVIFASIYTLGMKRHLEVFSPDDFDLIVVDEFHHAAAQSYQRVIDYFKPKFLLGITATPDRMDGKDVFAICDGNVAYQIHFIEAIQKQWLAPFHYYGVYDDRELGRRPTYLELHLQGNAPSQEYKQEYKSYVGFLNWADELSVIEKEAFKEAGDWLIEVEKTGMAKSYKMVVLKYMLSRGVDHWLEPVTPEEVAPFFHKYLTEREYRERIDFSDKAGKQLWNYDEKKVARLIATMPMTKWSGSSKGKVLYKENDNKFNIRFNKPVNKYVFNWIKEINEYRLHFYFERKENR
jgi:Type III restriction enzyme, res subunit